MKCLQANDFGWNPVELSQNAFTDELTRTVCEGNECVFVAVELVGLHLTRLDSINWKILRKVARGLWGPCMYFGGIA